MINTQSPQFSPKGGVGTVWNDPTTGKSWKYTQTGWTEAGSGDIGKDTQDKGTFKVKAEDDEVVKALKLGGAKEADIQNALKQRQEILAKKQAEDPQSPIGSDDQMLDPPVGNKGFDPFSGKSKTEVLRDAFNNGVTSSKELDEIGKIYDTLVTPVDENQDLSMMSPSEKAATINQLEKTAMEKAISLPDAQTRQGPVASFATFKSGKEIIDILESGTVKTGLTEGATRNGVFGVGARSLGKTTAEEDYFAALSETFAANFRKAISGTAVNDKEMQRLDRFLPSENKTKQANIEGIMAIADYLGNMTSSTIGMDVSALKPQRANSDPLNLLGGGKVSKTNPLGI